jgi:hypothetical protein
VCRPTRGICRDQVLGHRNPAPEPGFLSGLAWCAKRHSLVVPWVTAEAARPSHDELFDRSIGIERVTERGQRNSDGHQAVSARVLLVQANQ